MKKAWHSILILSAILIFSMCAKDTPEEETEGLSFIEALPGGCNGQGEFSMKSAIDEQDTVLFTMNNDTLQAFVGINYICCAPFVTESVISNDSIYMTIHDTCAEPYTSCYCKCMCYYSWDFFFAGLEDQTYYYQVILIDPREDGPQVFREGKVE